MSKRYYLVRISIKPAWSCAVADKDARTVIDLAFKRYDIALGSGLSEVAGKVFRIGHLGDMNALTLAGALAGVEMALADAGFAITLGSGVGAALAEWRVQA